MATGVPTIAATSTLAMLRTAVARGVMVDDLLEETNLSWEWLQDPDARLPAPTVLSLWNTLRERTSDPALQLVAPTTLPFGAYRVIDYLVAASATVGEGVERFARFFGLIAETLTLRVTQDGDGHSLTLATAEGGSVPPVYVDYVFAALVNRIRMRIRPDLRVRSVDMRQPKPQYAGTYRTVFCAPVRFGADADRLSLSTKEWAAPTANGDAALVALLEDHARILAERTASRGSQFVEDVKKVIASTLAEGATVERTAGALHVSVRTLQRRLIDDGTTFRELSETVKGQLAEGYLSDRAVSVSEVAVLLGFSEQSAFNRAFHRWTGESPGRWRRMRAVPRVSIAPSGA